MITVLGDNRGQSAVRHGLTGQRPGFYGTSFGSACCPIPHSIYYYSPVGKALPPQLQSIMMAHACTIFLRCILKGRAMTTIAALSTKFWHDNNICIMILHFFIMTGLGYYRYDA